MLLNFNSEGLDRYIKGLSNPDLMINAKDKPQQFIEMDPAKEADYMSEHAYRLKENLRAIPVTEEPLRILDIGPTPFTIFIKHAFPHYSIFALDRTALLKERFQNAGITLIEHDLDNGSIPFEDNFFDVIIFTEVLEHIFCPPSIILHEVSRIVKPNGKLILSVPNIAALGNRIKLFLGHSILENADQQMSRDWVHGHAHLHEYTRREILSLSKTSGFKVTKCEMLSLSPVSIMRGYADFSLKRFIYFSILAVAPHFRFTIFLECYKDESIN